MSFVRENLMTQPGYTPYCGADWCMNRTRFDGAQFRCACGWCSQFPEDFIAAYKTKWGK